MLLCQRKSEGGSFLRLVESIAENIPPQVTRRSTLIQLFAYEAFALAVKRMEDFSTLVNANEHLQNKLTSEEIWDVWRRLNGRLENAYLSQLGQRTTEQIHVLNIDDQSRARTKS